MQTPASILERLLTLSSFEGYDEVECFLRDRSTVFHKRWSEACTTVAEANRIWGTRLWVADSKGFNPVQGLRQFVAALKELPSDTVLEKLSLENSDQFASFWFDKASKQPVGFIMVSRSQQNTSATFP